MRSSTCKSNCSAYQALQGNNYYTHTPTAQPGMQVLDLYAPGTRPTWDPHGTTFTLDPLRHHRCYKVVHPSTGKVSPVSNLTWRLYSDTVPLESLAKELCRTIQQLKVTLRDATRTLLLQSAHPLPSQRTPVLEAIEALLSRVEPTAISVQPSIHSNLPLRVSDSPEPPMKPAYSRRPDPQQFPPSSPV